MLVDLRHRIWMLSSPVQRYPWISHTEQLTKDRSSTYVYFRKSFKSSSKVGSRCTGRISKSDRDCRPNSGRSSAFFRTLFNLNFWARHSSTVCLASSKEFTNKPYALAISKTCFKKVVPISHEFLHGRMVSSNSRIISSCILRKRSIHKLHIVELEPSFIMHKNHSVQHFLLAHDPDRAWAGSQRFWIWWSVVRCSITLKTSK